MTDHKVFSITVKQVNEFLEAQGAPPLTWLEQLNIRPALRYGTNISGFIEDAMHYLRGGEIRVVDDLESVQSHAAEDVV